MRRQLTVLPSATAIFAFAGTANAGLTGSATFAGKAPAESAIDMSKDPKCKELAPGAKTDDHKVKDGKLADVFVYVKNPPAGKHKPPKTPVGIDQKGCRYSPKVFGIMVKQKLEITNSDPTLHNIHAFAKRGEFNIGMPTQGQKIKKKFKKAQVMVSIKCDVHPWMQAYAGVMKHPFFSTTNDKGEFSIDGLPDGEYDVVAWHPKLGEKTAKVKVAGGNGTAAFAFGK
jgi:hypothetical protein